MKRTPLPIVIAATLCFAVNLNSFGQTTPGSMLYTPNVNLAAGAQNTFAGTVGGIFLTTYSFYPQVNWLGYYDENETLEGLLAFQVYHTGQAIREATGCGTASYATAIPPCLADRIRASMPDAEKLGRLNVRYVLSYERLADPDLRLVMNGDPAVYENLLWQPRARLTNDGSAEIVGRSAGEFEIKVDVASPEQLIVAETWLPGWQATVDGQPRNVERVEDALIGVSVEPGEHVVRFVYDPLPWEIGWRVSAVALTGLVVWVVVTLWQRKTR